MDDARTLDRQRARRAQAHSWVTRWELRYSTQRAAQRLGVTAAAVGASLGRLAAAYGDTDLAVEIDRMWADD